MTCILYQPGNRMGTFVEISNTCEAIHSAIGGYFQTLQIAKGLIAIIDEEGRLKKLPVNRWHNAEQSYGWLYGPILIVRQNGEDFCSIRDGDLKLCGKLLVDYGPPPEQAQIIEFDSIEQLKAMFGWDGADE